MWDDAFPSFLIGLREGLEAGLIVSVLVATLVRSDQRARLPHVWTGVAAAIGLSTSFGAVLTFTAANLSGKSQEAFGGTLSLVAVVFVTAMVFWMRRSARTFSGEIRQKVTAALGMGTGVLIATSFLAVGREGLETALFLWTTAQAAGSSSGPLAGAAAGLLIAAALCWGLYRRVLHINLTRFFTITGAVLIVIAAGVLGYGMRDLQEATVIPGGTSYAFDLSAHLDPASWYVTVVQGTLNLTPQMTWLQVGVYGAYLAIVMTLFVRGVPGSAVVRARSSDGSVPAGVAGAVADEPAEGANAAVLAATDVARATKLMSAPPLDSAEAEKTAEPAATQGAAVAAPGAGSGSASTVVEAERSTAPAPVGDEAGSVSSGADKSAAPTASSVTEAEHSATLATEGEKPAEPASSGPDKASAPTEPPAAKPSTPRRFPRWTVPAALVAAPALIAGITIAASGGKPASGTPVVEVSATDCGRGFTAPKPGRQTFQVRNTGSRTSEIYLIDPVSNAVYGEVEGIAPGTTRALIATVGTGSYAWRCVPNGGKAVTSAAVRVSAGGGSVQAVLPVSEKDLAAPLAAYRAYVDQGLADLQTKTRTLRSDIDAGKLDRAREDWLAAHTRYASLGAAYGTFADFDAKINGRTAGLAGGVEDPAFTGFHRIEYGLWHGRSAATLAPYTKRLAADVDALRKDFPKQDFDPADLPLRTHEILENTLHRELSGTADYGSGTELATTEANLDGTRELLTLLRPLIDKRNAEVLPAVDTWMRRTEQLVLAQRAEDGTWTPLDKLSDTDRQRLDGTVSQLLEDLAPIPDLLEIRKAA
ncbi:FTR1 family protein [Streptomyces sp. NBC_01340]|uniref:iron uptake transporter permease EfeU n=1 Tax=unclassified Streptomyces TaxID=2593676 RepID=UPI002252286D|nr:MULTISPECIES: iron uptake transporter permease EfeU [unclassified Streptomyces]MCX4459007.1 FTR1 family protein [Streptomyces sp. NBC_01719]MCX4498364.1 FTR1 family protein [Streptomyces sp. NBC_01728]MCX4595768.1 FTR1 family protein [Streptomyces sp. NBC_01549]WSI42873.1 FTR1 family protein [Streptomyces sp. NBC_01340]